MIPTPGRWEPKKRRYITDDEYALGTVRGMLNKITTDKFNHLSEQIMKFLTDQYRANEVILKGIIDSLFEKAVVEPKFCPLYADLCKKLRNCKIDQNQDNVK